MNILTIIALLVFLSIVAGSIVLGLFLRRAIRRLDGIRGIYTWSDYEDKAKIFKIYAEEKGENQIT